MRKSSKVSHGGFTLAYRIHELAALGSGHESYPLDRCSLKKVCVFFRTKMRRRLVSWGFCVLRGRKICSAHSVVTVHTRIVLSPTFQLVRATSRKEEALLPQSPACASS